MKRNSRKQNNRMQKNRGERQKTKENKTQRKPKDNRTTEGKREETGTRAEPSRACRTSLLSSHSQRSLSLEVSRCFLSGQKQQLSVVHPQLHPPHLHSSSSGHINCLLAPSSSSPPPSSSSSSGSEYSHRRV